MHTLTNDQVAALNARSGMRRWFIWCDALDGAGDPAPAGFWDDVGNVIVESRTYYGSGTVISIGDMEAVSDLSIPGLTVTMSGLESASINAVRGNILAQRPITVYLGIYDVSSRALIPPLIPCFVGVVDDIEIITPEEGGTTSIVLTCESASRALTIGRTGTRSPATCKERNPSDKFYDYTAGQAERVLYFGRATPPSAKHQTKSVGGGSTGRRGRRA